MGFEKVYVTKQGLQLEAKARTGKILKILRVEVGDGQLTNNNIAEQTALINKKLDCNINSMQDINSQTIINFILQQSNVEEGFYFREFGVIAEEPDTKEEVLYMYANARGKTEYINDKTSKSISDKIVDIIVNEEALNNIDKSLSVTVEQIKNIAEDLKTTSVNFKEAIMRSNTANSKETELLKEKYAELEKKYEKLDSKLEQETVLKDANNWRTSKKQVIAWVTVGVLALLVGALGISKFF